MSIKIKKEQSNGIKWISGKSKSLNFTIYQGDSDSPPGSGHVEVIQNKEQIFVSESGLHRHRIQQLKAKAKKLRSEARLLEDAALAMEAHSFLLKDPYLKS